MGEDEQETESETEEGLEGHSSLTPFQMLRILFPPNQRKKEMNTPSESLLVHHNDLKGVNE